MAITAEIGETNFDKMIVQTAAGASSNDNVFNAAGSVFVIQGDNSSGTDAYLKLYDSSGPTVGTTAPDVQIYCKGNVTQNVICRGGIVFSTGLSLAAVQEAGTAGNTGAASSLQVTIIGA
tara:strand:- start:1017 stop:1376 length:360 start_codon:yes stop_codon:yes gene_type:complete